MEGWKSKEVDTFWCSLEQFNHDGTGVRQVRPAIRYMDELLFGPIDDWISGLHEKLADNGGKVLMMLPGGMCLRGTKFVDHSELGIRIFILKVIVLLW